jgi:large subunit ribosomal protein L29
MKTSELRAKDAAGLEKEVSELLKAHFGLRMQKATQQLTNHSQLKNTRRDIARAKTIQAEQKRAAAAGAHRRGQEDRSQEMNADVTTPARRPPPSRPRRAPRTRAR